MQRFKETRPRGKRPARLAMIAALVVGLAACSGNRGAPGPSSSSAEPPPPQAQPTTRVQAEPLDTPGLMQNKSDAARVAFLAPLSGQAATTGQALLNAAQIAAIEVGPANFILQPYDTGGSPAGAAQAARMALAQGAGMIVGPLFAESVRAVAPIAAQANVPVVAFSTDQSVAGGSVHLIGFLASEQIRRILGHVRRQGRTTVAALLPATPEGRATAEIVRQGAAAFGLRVTGIEHYDPQGADAAAVLARLRAGGTFDTLVLADRGPGMRAIVAQLPAAGFTPGQVQIVGTMVWQEETSLGQDPMLVGARFPAPDENALESFRTRYRATYGAQPPVLAGLGYDATALAAVLARAGAQAFTISAVRNQQGFMGVGGLFRFRTDGSVERGLAIREVKASGSVQVEPAPTSFSGAVY